MRQFWALVRVLLNINFGLSYAKQTYIVQKKRLWEPVLIIFGLGVGLASILTGYVYLLRTMYAQGQVLGQGNFILTLSLVAGQIMVLLLGIFWVTSVFYFSRDTMILVPLPLPASTVLLGKFTTLMVNEYVTLLFVVGPAFIVYGIMAGMGFGYWVTALLVFLLIPVIPLAVSSLAAVVIMRYANIKRSRTLLMFVGTLLFLGAYFGFQYYIMQFQPQSEQEFLQYVMTIQDSLSRSVAARFPPSLWATIAMSRPFTASGLANLGLFVAVSAAMLAAVMFFASRLFYAGLLSGTEVGSGRRGQAALYTGVGARRGVELVQRSPEMACAIRDLWIFARTPSFVLNGVMNALIFPGLLVVWFLIGGSGSMFAQIPGFDAFLHDPSTVVLRALVFAAAVVWTAGIHMVSSTAFSREGANFWVSKVIPVPARRQVTGKVFFALAFEIVTSIPMIAVLQLVLRLTPGMFGLAVLLGLIGAVGATFMVMYMDMLRPYLKWDNPQKAMKGNLNGLFGWLIVQVVLAAAGFLVWRATRAGWTASAILSAAFVGTAVFTAGMFVMLFRSAEKAYRFIEL
ncbi:MAG: hypothetical protein NUW23_15235 [Firmicutes bacterium]|nr:hypothetical protein [Bacillota bacterium]